MWMAEARAAAFDRTREATALRRLMEGPGHARLAAAAAAVNQTAKLAAAVAAWAAWAAALGSATSGGGRRGEDDGALLGAAVERVVGQLEAPHLQPSGIGERLDGGLDAACFGLFTLLQWLGTPPGVVK